MRMKLYSSPSVFIMISVSFRIPNTVLLQLFHNLGIEDQCNTWIISFWTLHDLFRRSIFPDWGTSAAEVHDGLFYISTCQLVTERWFSQIHKSPFLNSNMTTHLKWKYQDIFKKLIWALVKYRVYFQNHLWGAVWG